MTLTNPKRVSAKNSPYLYLKVQLTREGNQGDLTAAFYKFTVTQAIQENLGVVGAATQVDLLKTWSGGYAILRIPNSLKEKIWAALTLYSAGKSGKCAFRVLQTSPYLMALAFDSRSPDGQILNAK